MNEKSEGPQESQIIRDMGGKVRFTIPGDGRRSVTPKDLKDKLDSQDVLKRVDIKRVESIE